MLSLNQLQLFKTDKCEERLCQLNDAQHIKQCTLEELTDCEYFHSEIDKRRSPFIDLKKFILRYKFDENKQEPESGCLNRLEYLYHPEFYKSDECSNRKCKWYYCPYYHNKSEKDTWDKIRSQITDVISEDTLETFPKFTQNIRTLPQRKLELNIENYFENTNRTSTLNFSSKFEDFMNKEYSEEDKHDTIEELKEEIESLGKGNFSENSEKIISAEFQQPEKIDPTPLNDNADLDQTFISRHDEPGPNLDEIPDIIPKNLSDKELFDNFINKNKKNPMPGSQLYFLWKPVDMAEDETHEFKIFQNDRDLEDIINKYLCGFLNAKGGVLYLGIRDDGMVVGVPHSRRDLDKIKVTVDYLAKKFYPPVLSSQYKVEERYIYDSNKGSIDNSRRIIEVIISPGDSEELYFNGNSKAYIRKRASCTILTPPEIKIEIRNRARHSMARNLISLIDDPTFDEEIEKMSVEQLNNFKETLKKKYDKVKKMLSKRQDAANTPLYEKLIGKATINN